MPLLFSITIRVALEEVATALPAGEQLCADDALVVRFFESQCVCVICWRKHWSESQGSSCIRENECGAESGSHIVDLGPEVWQHGGNTWCWAHPWGRNSISQKMDHESHSDGTGSAVADSAPECKPEGQSHSLRPRIATPTTTKVLWDGLPAGEEDESHQLATLPMRMRGLGLRAAARCAPAACWTSWADALHMISERTPGVSDVARRVGHEELLEDCSGERPAATELDRKGFLFPKPETREHCEWPHGGQYWASSVFDTRRIRC